MDAETSRASSPVVACTVVFVVVMVVAVAVFVTRVVMLIARGGAGACAAASARLAYLSLFFAGKSPKEPEVGVQASTGKLAVNVVVVFRIIRTAPKQKPGQ